MPAETITMPGLIRPEPTTQGPTKAARQQSKIDFPYYDLDAAVETARLIYYNGGTECTIDQLAGFLKTTVNSSSFKMRLSNVRMFGLLDRSASLVRLTPLGRDILDPIKEKAARVQAFLNVPLYRALHDKFRGGLLPAGPGLQNVMCSLGVVASTAERARWTFERSAEQAGFFELGKDRLVSPSSRLSAQLPATVAREEVEPAEAAASPARSPGTAVAQSSEDLHPFIRGLLESLPAPGTLWMVEGRAKWLQAAAHIFDLMYKGDGLVEVHASKGQRGRRDDAETREPG
jgi:hypothetical protein